MNKTKRLDLFKGTAHLLNGNSLPKKKGRIRIAITGLTSRTSFISGTNFRRELADID